MHENDLGFKYNTINLSAHFEINDRVRWQLEPEAVVI